MARRICPDCGAPLQFSSQKFCTSCGAALPESLHAAVPAGAGLPLIPLAAGIVVVLIVVAAGALFILPALTKNAGAAQDSIPGSGNGGQHDGILPGTPAETLTMIPATITTRVTPVPTTAPTTPPTTIPTTTSTPSPTPTPTPTTTAPTPTPRPTSVIIASETRVPAQPPSSSYTSSTPGAPYIDPGALEARIHELTNVQRQNNGLSTFSYDPFLADIARGHSWDMVQQNYFEHVNPAGLNARGRGDWAGYPCVRVIGLYTYSGISENLYQGHRAGTYYTDADGTITSYDWRTLEEIAQVTVNGWMESPGHRQNILTPHISSEGIGVAFGPDDKVYVTQNFC